MHKKTVGILAVIVGLIIFVFGMYTYALPDTTQTKTETISPSNGIFVQLQLEQQSNLKGSLSVLGGAQGINVYIADPNEEVIYNGGTVFTSLEFSVTAPTSGTYKVNFDNPSPANTQTIEYSVTYPADFPKTISLTIIAAGTLLLVGGIAVTLILSKQTPHSEP